MSRDLYPALSGALGAWRTLEMVADNLANSSTTAFKATRMSFQLTGPDGHPLGQSFAEALPPATDARDGAVIRDDIPTHLALQGPGFFLVQGPTREGNTLTRDGRFGIDTAQRLVDSRGMAVMGSDGPIVLPRGETIQINADGTVIGSLSGAFDKVRVVLPTGQVQRAGGNRFATDAPVIEVPGHVIQGALEASNVDPLSAMVELIEASRNFEAFQKAMQASDELDARLNRSAGGN